MGLLSIKNDKSNKDTIYGPPQTPWEVSSHAQTNQQSGRASRSQTDDALTGPIFDDSTTGPKLDSAIKPPNRSLRRSALSTARPFALCRKAVDTRQ
jgi:hypothetical protein